MKHKQSSLRAVLSVAMAASMLAQTGLQTLAAASEATSDPFDSEKVAIFETDEPSKFGYTPYRIVDEDGNEIEMELTPDMSDLGSYAAGLPTSYDLRDYGLVTSVKNQNPTGTCWAHAAMASGESMLIKDGLATTDIDLSEAHLVWFSIGSAPTDVNDPLYHDGYEKYNLGTGAYNNGGNSYISAGTLSSWVGAAPEADYANVATSPTLSEADRYDSIYHLQNAYLFDGEDRDIIKSYLMNNGALTISYYHDDMFYNSSNYAYYCNIADPNTSTGGGHAVTIVGWDDSFSKSNFPTAPEGDGAWLIKNSWGTWWGDEGYFWMSYYDKNIDDIRSIELEPTTNYTDIYQYAGVYNTFYYNDNYNGNMGVIFTSDSNDPISAVSFQTTKASTPYEIRIYSGSTYGSPLSGTLVHTQTGTATYAGLQTIKLDKLISVPSGTNFSVFIHMAKNGSGVAVDDNSSTTGRCYYAWGSNMDSVTWKDMGTNYNYDIHIKAYTSTAATPKPTNIKATAGDGQVTLTWDKVTGATKYAVSIYKGTGTNYNTLTTSITGTSYTATGLTNGTTYQFLVQAYVNGKWSTFTTADHVSATPVGTAKPTNIKATAGDGQVTLTWDKVTGATKYAVSIYKGTGTNYNTLTTSITGTSYTATGLTNGTTYQFLVQAYVNGKWNTFTTADHVSATPVGTAKPTNVKATAGDGQVKLTWSAVSGATKYAVSIYKGTGTSYNTLSTSITGTSYTATGLTNGTTYQFLVQAYVGGKWNTFTTADHVSATPVGTAKPTNVKATAGDGQVTLTWSAVSGATKYAVSIYKGTGTSYNTLSTSITGTSYTATGLTNGTTYQFLVQAYVGGKWNTFTTADHVSATPVASNSTKPVVHTSIGDSQVALAWNAVSGATKYAISSYNASTGKYSVLNDSYTNTYCYITGLVNNNTYRYLVQAYVNGKWSTFTTADHVVVTPKAISKPSAIATAGNGRGRLVWAAVTGATKYAVSRYYPATGKYTVLNDNWTSTNCEFPNLTNGTTYIYLVQAYVNGAWSKFSTADHVTITPAASSAFITAEEAGAADAYSDEQMDDSDLILDENDVLYQF